ASAAGRKAFEQSGQCARAGRVIISDIRHQLPRLLPDLESAPGLLNADYIVLRFEQRTNEGRVLPCSSSVTGETSGDLCEVLHADQSAGQVQEIAGIFRSEQLHHYGRGGPHIFHRIVAVSFFEPRLRPVLYRQARRGCRVEHRGFLMAREYHALLDLERMVVLAVVAFKSILAIDTLLGADEAQIGIAESDSVIAVPASQHRLRHF